MRFALVLKLTALGLAASLSGCDSSDNVDAVSNVETLEEADTVYLNGNIITVDDANPKATAVAVKDGNIIYVC